MPKIAMPASSAATTRNGCAPFGVSLGSSQLPSAIPPMNAHSNTATEIDEAPTTSWTR